MQLIEKFNEVLRTKREVEAEIIALFEKQISITKRVILFNDLPINHPHSKFPAAYFFYQYLRIVVEDNKLVAYFMNKGTAGDEDGLNGKVYLHEYILEDKIDEFVNFITDEVLRSKDAIIREQILQKSRLVSDTHKLLTAQEIELKHLTKLLRQDLKELK